MDLPAGTDAVVELFEGTEPGAGDRLRSFLADAVVLATGGYGKNYFLSTMAKGCNATAIWRAYK